jgi:phosphoglycolate phosphatase-like HAD superfamily hydrolase
VRPTVLLFDIDGTLINAAGAGRRALERAFLRRFGSGRFLEFAFDGMTDPHIVEAGLRTAGIGGAEIETEMGRMLASYLEILRETCAAATNFRVHAGVEAALEAAARCAAVAVGLGTGNVAEGARLKLDRVGLARHFGFGGYGDDSPDRATLLAVGARRGAERVGAALEDCRVVVIGDTPRDIAAARAMGAECAAVATGSYPLEELRALAPTFAFDDLAAPAALEALLSSSSPRSTAARRDR